MDYEKKIREYLNSDEVDQLYKSMLINLFPELAESEDEMIRKEIIEYIKTGTYHKSWIAWLERQGTPAKLSEEEQNKFAKGVLTSCALSFIDYLDAHKYEGKMCVSNGECEDIENAFHNAIWDRLHRYYCKYIEKQGEHTDIPADAVLNDNKDGLIAETIRCKREKQGEQKPVVPKFRVGDFIANDYCFGKVIALTDDAYLLDTGQGIPFSCEYNAHLWTIQDAKDGDVLITPTSILIFKKYLRNNNIISYCHCNSDFYPKTDIWADRGITIHPVTKQQRNILFNKMKEAGYEWDAEKKELKKIEQKPVEPDNLIEESYQQQADDLIDMVTEKPAWSEEDEIKINRIVACLENLNVADNDILLKDVDWLKFLKDRVQPQNRWKPTEEQMMCLDSAIREYQLKGYPAKTLESLYEQLKAL